MKYCNNIISIAGWKQENLKKTGIIKRVGETIVKNRQQWESEECKM